MGRSSGVDLPGWVGPGTGLNDGVYRPCVFARFCVQKAGKFCLVGQISHRYVCTAICTMDMPFRFYRLRYGSPGHKAMKQMTLQYVGIKNLKILPIGPMRLSKESFREKWLVKIQKFGQKDA